MNDAADQVYAEAAILTGKSEAELRCMGLAVFASILRHCLEEPQRVTWIAATLRNETVIDLEVAALFSARTLLRAYGPNKHPDAVLPART